MKHLFVLGSAALILINWMCRDANAQGVDKQLQDLYETARTAEDEETLTAVLARSDELSNQNLSDEQKAYLRRLQSWTLNRRGEVFVKKAASLTESGQTEQARQWDARALADFEKAVTYDAENWKALHNRSVSYALQRDFARAIEGFRKVTELKPNYVNAWFNLAELDREQGHVDEAAEAYGQVLRLKPSDRGALLGRGLVRLQQGMAQEALRDFQQVLAATPDDAQVLIHRAEAYQALGQWEQAAEDLRKANQLASRSPWVYQAAAWLMATCPDARFRQDELAVEAAERAIELTDRADYRFFDTLAAAYANAGRWDEAVQTQQKAISAAGDSPVRSDLQVRLTQYERHEPYRQTGTGDP